MAEATNSVIDRTEQSFNDDSLMNIRLNTDPLMAKIECFLSGTRRVIQYDEEGVPLGEALQQVGLPLVNKEGLNGLLQSIEMRVNPHTVQGNFPTYQDFENFIYFARIEVMSAVVSNAADWEISDNKIEMIIDTIMSFIEMFTSRLIGNKERESYKGGFQSREVHVVGDGPKGLARLGSGFGK